MHLTLVNSLMNKLIFSSIGYKILSNNAKRIMARELAQKIDVYEEKQ